jgi:hypothetical protein
VARRGLSTLNIWLGLFAMLMIHVGPLYSAFSAAPSPAGFSAEHTEHAADAGHTHSEHAHHSPQPHHGSTNRNAPEWLLALELCGYCELLTLSPPLALSLELVIPRHTPSHIQPLPDEPLPPSPRRTQGQPRAPPQIHS